MKVILRPLAELDVTEASEFYALIGPALARAFVHELRDQLARLADNPRLYQRVVGEVRRTLTRRFPFAIYYLIESDFVDVLAVLHTSRRPSIWQDRVDSPA